ncbi:MAG: FKBP-type peptidyl-prolyl cis-trans isomerase [Muribaculaceae bacterium]|nr:FKBP-type peptidyl-prolyl cis-trans isomerase [Muribaculaceae bacterium]
MILKLSRTALLAAIGAVTATCLTSCLNDDEPDYNEWQQLNSQYVAEKEALTEGGIPVFTKLTPSWAPAAFTLVKWENDRNLTAKNLQPMDNSLVRVQYALDDIYGNRISDSYSATASYGDSIYQTRPMDNIVGFWNTLTEMRVGDEVTCIIPASAGYGNVQNGAIPPYSTLVYKIKLVSIPRYEVPS